MERPVDMHIVWVSRLHRQEGSFVAHVFEGERICWWEGWAGMFQWPGRPFVEAITAEVGKAGDGGSRIDRCQGEIDSNAMRQRPTYPFSLLLRVIEGLCGLASYGPCRCIASHSWLSQPGVI